MVLEPLVIPEDAGGPKYEQRLRAYNAQDTLIQSLAERFVDSGFDAKALFADMVMSNWYRHSLLANESAVIDRDVELASIGRGRILTPEELDRKNIAVFGRTWQQWQDGTNPHGFGLETAFSGQWARYRNFYGGIDGAVVTVVIESSLRSCPTLPRAWPSTSLARLLFRILIDRSRSDLFSVGWRGIRFRDIEGVLHAAGQGRRHVPIAFA
ncbi:MAG: hypothetical protein CM15mP84_07960 [Cellvibrionales bacterium]|nr:MAG: hypothetical protein CM15mP84_07960 [Cellvibrionales bacterium]